MNHQTGFGQARLSVVLSSYPTKIDAIHRRRRIYFGRRSSTPRCVRSSHSHLYAERAKLWDKYFTVQGDHGGEWQRDNTHWLTLLCQF